MIPKPIDSIAPVDLDALVAAPRVEDRQIDYKLDLPGGSDDDKREFLADVVAFANAFGGDLVFGVEEHNGTPIRLRGVAVTNFDELRLRLQNVIREATDPKIVSVDAIAVGHFERGPVVILRVHQSWQAPHMVSYKRWSRFFFRDSGQRHQMDANELRIAFVGGEAATQRIQAFRSDRVAAIAAGVTPVTLFPHAASVVHILPIGPAFTTSTLDPRAAQTHVAKLFASELVNPANVGYNLDGLLIYPGGERKTATDAYIQIFRNSGVEAVTTFTFMRQAVPEIEGGPHERLVVRLLKAVGEFRRALQQESPVAVFLTLINVANLPLLPPRPDFASVRRFDRAVLMLPETLLTDFSRVDSAVRPTFDAMWQASGWSGSPFYDDAGNWTSRL